MPKDTQGSEVWNRKHIVKGHWPGSQGGVRKPAAGVQESK